MSAPQMVDPKWERRDLKVSRTRAQELELAKTMLHPGISAMDSKSLEEGFNERMHLMGLKERDINPCYKHRK